MSDRICKPTIRTAAANPRAARAFTLVELMLSIAISLILILGIARVFSYSSQAVGAGQALASVSRDARAAAGVFAQDFAHAVVDGSPCIILRSQQVYAFHDPADYASASVQNTFTNVNNGVAVPDPQYDEQGAYVDPADYGTRSHRIDIFSFFAQGIFHRQTANTRTGATNVPVTAFVADQTAPEAWVWYGHLAQPDNTLSESHVRNPGQVTGPDNSGGQQSPQSYNPNNLFASQWIFGRQAILLQPADFNYMMYDRSGIPQDYLCRPMVDYSHRTTTPTGATPPFLGPSGGARFFPPRVNVGTAPPSMSAMSAPWTVPSLYPLDANTTPLTIQGSNLQSAASYKPSTLSLWTSRYDVANTSIAQFRDILKNYIEEQSMQRTNGARPLNVDWWDPLMTTTRFYANPYIQKPLAPPAGAAAGTIDYNKQAAQLAPCMLAGCSQFIVEYAGDFLNQDPATGLVTNTYVDGPTDGQIDYVLDAQGNRQIRWYGLPRSVTAPANGAAGVLPVQSNTLLTSPTGTIIQQSNVYPLVDIWATARNPKTGQGPSTVCAPFEKIFTHVTPPAGQPLWPPLYPQNSTYWPAPAAPPDGVNGGLYFNRRTSRSDYAPTGITAPASLPNGALRNGEFYTCAWGPYDRKPSMIRITITLEDANNRLASGQTFEFVYRLGNGNSN